LYDAELTFVLVYGEKLVETVLQHIRSQTASGPCATHTAPNVTIVDICSGSGCCVISLLTELPNAEGIAMDVSAEALQLSKRNAEKHQVSNRLTVMSANVLSLDFPNMLSSVWTSRPSNHKFVFLSNPPYIPTADVLTLEPQVKDHEPRLALDGGTDGLHFYRAFSQWKLPPHSLFAMEIGIGQSPDVCRLFSALPDRWIVKEVKQDLSGIDRVVVALSV
jgi:release factor glutamine methyltransferase